MIYDYQDQEGWVSVWVGSCGRWAALDEYLSDVYLEEWENCRPHPKALEALAKVVLPENAGRPFEEELRDCFNGESYNQFGYDFGLVFDEDFREAEALEAPTKDLEKLIPFSESSGYVPLIREQYGDTLPAYNAAVALYNFRYTGGVKEARHNGIYLRFLGCFPCEL